MRIAFRHSGLLLLLAPVLLVSVTFGQEPPPANSDGDAHPSSQSGSARAQNNARAGRGIRGPNRAPLDPAEQARRKERVQMARDLLDLSYSIGSTMPASDRAKVLPRQISAATSIDPKLAAQWAEEEDCVSDARGAIAKLESWLNAVPLEVGGA